MTLHLTIVTQEKELLDLEVDSVTATTTTGELTILPGHIPLMTKLTDTELIYRIKGQTYSVAVSGGFMNVEPDNHIIILTDAAIRSEDINEASAQAARDRAEATMKEQDSVSKTQFALAEGELRRAILQLKVAKKRKGTV